MTKGIDHERNDRIEAAVLGAALASLVLLVALAVSTSVSAVSRPGLAPATAAETARGEDGIDPTAAGPLPRELR